MVSSENSVPSKKIKKSKSVPKEKNTGSDAEELKSQTPKETITMVSNIISSEPQEESGS